MPSFSTFVIHLERDIIRYEHMKGLLKRLDVQGEFVPAVDGLTLSETNRNAYDRDKALRAYGVEMMDTEIGCCSLQEASPKFRMCRESDFMTCGIRTQHSYWQKECTPKLLKNG
jgi:hypothetical protein